MAGRSAKVGYTNKSTLKSQSAMEFLMTYGWAILIVSVVLGALYSMGVFNQTSTITTSCVPSSGYFCSITSYSSSTGNILVIVSQNTGMNWGDWGIAYCAGCIIGSSGPSSLTYNVQSTTLSTLMKTTTVLPASVPGSSIGTTSSGSIWVCYTSSTVTYLASSSGPCTSGTNTVNFVRIATVNAKSS